ncbi:prepilin-type N-terminal cleavage/methylation domain-containing protein [Coraliomargarita sp. W4R53]
MNFRSKKSAFTLIELLVVISIILIASSIIFIGGSGGDGAKLTSSQRIVSGIAQGARGQAILKNSKTRLIIYSDGNTAADANIDKLLRFVGIVYYGTDNDGVEGWMAATQGTYLPEGVYFNPDGEPKTGTNPWSKNTMTLDYPRLRVGSNTNEISGGGSEEYYYYEFNSNGTMASGFDNNWLVLQAGTLKPSTGGDYEIDFTDETKEAIRAALILRKMGTTTRVDDPDDIKSPI